MDDKKLLRKALALEPADAPTHGGDSARAIGNDASADPNAKRDLQITTTDRFLAKAAKEYQVGNVDQALWRRAEDHFGADASLVIAGYLRSRATALRLQHKKEESLEIQARGAAKSRSPMVGNAEAEPRAEVASTRFVSGVRPDSKLKPWHLAAAGAALTAMVVVVYLIVSPPESEPVRRPVVSEAAPAANPATKPSAPRSEPLAVNSTGGTSANQGNSEPAFAATVQQLKKAGKWNLLVLNATEWTRQEPGNAAAWSELSIGYVKLQQYNDAVDAATKAVQLSPADPVAWRTLGQINLAVDRVPEAGIAFDKALALRPEDAEARCGAALIAQKQARPKDGEATTRRVKPVDGSCPN